MSKTGRRRRESKRNIALMVLIAPLAVLTAHILEIPSEAGDFQIDPPQGLRRMLRTIEMRENTVADGELSVAPTIYQTVG